MNKNAVYLAVFAALCLLAGVLVGASISKRPNLAWTGPIKPDFRARAERFMGYGPRNLRNRKPGDGFAQLLAVKLGLNAEQKAKVKEILENMRQQIDEVGKNLRSSIAGIKDKGDKQIMDILTPEQQEKFKALQKKFQRGRPNCTGGERGPMRGYGPPPDQDLPPQ